MNLPTKNIPVDLGTLNRGAQQEYHVHAVIAVRKQFFFTVDFKHVERIISFVRKSPL